MGWQGLYMDLGVVSFFILVRPEFDVMRFMMRDGSDRFLPYQSYMSEDELLALQGK